MSGKRKAGESGVPLRYLAPPPLAPCFPAFPPFDVVNDPVDPFLEGRFHVSRARQALKGPGTAIDSRETGRRALRQTRRRVKVPTRHGHTHDMGDMRPSGYS